jgi:glycosyltransferase involved in cell wall biosynthesis
MFCIKGGEMSSETFNDKENSGRISSKAEIAYLRALVENLRSERSELRDQVAEYIYHLDRINASPWWRLGQWFDRQVRNVRRLLSGKGKDAGPDDRSYQAWVQLYDTLSDADRQAIRAHLDQLTYKPLISIVMPAYNTPEGLLREAIDSVKAQLYPHWELCIADDASPSAEVAHVLAELAEQDPRIKWLRRDINGHISAASNSALTLAKGEFVALMDHDDILAERALYEIVVELNAHPDADLIYSDEDRIDENNVRFEPYFKTDWNPELFLGQNMISHLGVYRKTILDEVGGFRLGYEGSQDYDLALRVVAKTKADRIRHVPAVLYHWRGSTERKSFSEGQLQKCIAAARAAKQDYFDGRGKKVEIIENPYVSNWEWARWKTPEPAPLVSLIVATRNRCDLFGRCLDGLLEKTEYTPLEVIVVDHESSDPKTIALLDRWRSDSRVKMIIYQGAFNYADMINKAVAQTRGDLIGLVQDGIEIIHADWLDEMVSLAVQPENGAVGAKLLDRHDRVQHAGMLLGVEGTARTLQPNAQRHEIGYFGRLALRSNVSAVSGACLVLRKGLFEEVGGLDADNLPARFSDIDLCLKIQARGYHNVLTPLARLYYDETSSGDARTPADADCAQRAEGFLRKKWGDQVENDPYYNSNLSAETPLFRLAFPPRRRRPWQDYLS